MKYFSNTLHINNTPSSKLKVQFLNIIFNLSTENVFNNNIIQNEMRNKHLSIWLNPQQGTHKQISQVWLKPDKSVLHIRQVDGTHQQF